jgi:uncharacterized repeat protein (TIGR03943 family)
MLVLLGGTLIKIVTNDTYLHYVKPSSKWPLLAAGIIMVALGVASIVRDRRTASAEQIHHGHDHREPHSPWLLMLPVLAILLVAPPALGADALTRAARPNLVSPPSIVASFGPVPDGDAPELGLSEFVARSVWDDPRSLTGRDVSLIGFVAHQGGAIELARMVITCCAADAKPMVVRLRALGDGYPSGQWLQVRARLLPGTATAADGYTPSVRVVTATAVAAPAEEYEY